MGEKCLDALGVVLGGMDAAAGGSAQHQGAGHAAPGAGTQPRCVVRELVEGGVDEPCELDLAHGPETLRCHTDRCAADEQLRERGVEHAAFPEPFQQASVARNTPPFTLTSWPSTSTSLSSSIARESARFTALTSVTSAIVIVRHPLVIGVAFALLAVDDFTISIASPVEYATDADERPASGMHLTIFIAGPVEYATPSRVAIALATVLDRGLSADGVAVPPRIRPGAPFRTVSPSSQPRRFASRAASMACNPASRWRASSAEGAA